MADGVTVRRAKAADAALLPAIEHSADALFRRAPGLEWIADDAVMSAMDHEVAIAAGATWVADDAGVITGFLSGEVSGDALHVSALAVAEAAQGQGIGRQLIDVAAAWAKARGLAALTLTTFREVAWNAPWYTRLGFELLGEGALDDRLRAVLAREVSNGLPPERRCAMRLSLATSHQSECAADRKPEPSS